ncbi:PREDICTED: non-classical arabinogalactan protein 30-like isoform X2 [Ipomoea nil]|uniref:non-classical arabinogalactan protein 30-like isoform X2 n=1 Tax=Ipomoea nil TaxID=35883 RepID=UPI0009010402|nr:PREDICTED: non-classical arabinogalactan protein 30-like isoform X2 [Ipomoea nil]
MAIFQAKPFIFIHLLLVFLSSFSVLGHENGGAVSWALAPHSLPGLLSPAPAPNPPHKGGHHLQLHTPPAPNPPHKGGHHLHLHTPPATLPPPPAHSPPAATPPTPPPKAPTTPPPKPHHHHSSPPHVKPPAAPIPPPVQPPTPPPKAPATPPPKPHHHHHSPKPPAAPIPPPVKPPTPSPPVQRKAIAVRGLVYCKSCQYRGVDNLYKATPLEGAVVKLACNNTKYHLVEKAKTDKNGFFLIMPKTVTSAGFHKCKVFLVASPKPECSVFTNYKLGQAGAPLIPTPPPPELKSPPYQLFTVGPFAFEPSKKAPCPR